MIVSCGEALIDFVPMQGLDGQTGYRPCEGGSPMNIAVGLGRLGTPVGFLGKISTDFFGDMLVAHLEKNKVDTGLVVRGPENTTLGFVSLPGDGGEPQYAFVANGAADRTIAVADFPETLPDGVTALQFGSISLVQEPGASAYEQLMRREAGRRVMVLDPNIRPGLIPDHAAYVTRLEGWIGMMGLVRASVVDIEWLYPGEAIDAVAARWRGIGAAVVIVTLGSEGARAWASQGTAQAVGPAVPVADTVGAGDSFFSGALSWLDRHGHLSPTGLAAVGPDALETALAFGCRCAAITCSRPGADPPWAEEVL